MGLRSVTCEGFLSAHGVQVQRVACDELRCCELVREALWEAEEHVGRGGR